MADPPRPPFVTRSDKDKDSSAFTVVFDEPIHQGQQVQPAGAVLVLGESLVDRFADTSVAGGAPFNLARGLKGLGQPVSFATRYNPHDAAGRLIHAELERFDLNGPMAQVEPDWPSGVVDVQVDAQGQPKYTIASPAAWDHLQALPLSPSELERFRTLCFGTLALRHSHAQRSIFAMVRRAKSKPKVKAKPGIHVFLDLNLRETGPAMDVLCEALAQADWLKLNADELDVLAEALHLPAGTSARIHALAQAFGLSQVALTRGSDGSSLWSAKGQCIAQAKASPVAALADTVGAGDAFSAAWLSAQARGASATDALAFANAYAGAVCSHRGPVSPDPQFFEHWRTRLNALVA